MWTTPSRLLPADGEIVAVCLDGASPSLMVRKGGFWCGCDCFGKVTFTAEREPQWWTHLPWRRDSQKQAPSE